VNKYEFYDTLANRRPGAFSSEGADLLFDYLEDFEVSTGKELEFDPIALCIEYSEQHMRDIASDYDIDLSDCDSNDAILETVLDYLYQNTTVIGVLSDTQTILYFSEF
jgi:hypothetical protein